MAKPDPETPHQRIIGPEEAGPRLDRAVADWLGLTRASVLRLLDAGGIRCNGRVMTRSAKGRVLLAGDELVIDPMFVGRRESPRPDNGLAVSVLAEGPGWVIVDKPAEIPVRPHALDETGTALNAVVAKHPNMIGVGEGGLRSGVVHRLDNDTSGALAFALEQEAWHRLRQAFAEHRASKKYHALLHGNPESDGRSVQHLRVRKHAPAHVESCDQINKPDARRCELSWRVLERFSADAAWVEIDLHTGFLHQIRVMMARLGHGVIGDSRYAEGLPTYEAGRQMLHAAELEIEGIRAQAPLPNDFEQTIHRLRIRAGTA